MNQTPIEPDVLWNGSELVWAGNGSTFLRGVGKKYLQHPYFEQSFRKLLLAYHPDKKYKLCLFLVCSYGKPYSQSFIHYKIIEALKRLGEAYNRIHQVIVSNAGVIPRELEEYYPFCCYDWNPKFENDEIKRIYVKVLAKRLTRYIETFKSCYENFACYLRHNSDSYEAVKKVERSLGLPIPNLAVPREEVPQTQLRKVSLGIYNGEEDLVLITSKSLSTLSRALRRQVG